MCSLGLLLAVAGGATAQSVEVPPFLVTVAGSFPAVAEDGSMTLAWSSQREGYVRPYLADGTPLSAPRVAT